MGSGEKWPVNGTLIYNTLLQLMFQEREGKWEETTHADMFFTLRHHPEWQRDWGMLLFHVQHKESKAKGTAKKTK